MKVMKSRTAGQSKSNVDPYVMDLLENVNGGKTILQLQKAEKVFSQGDSAEAIYFVQTGKVKIRVYPTFPTDFGGSLGVLLTTTTEPGSGLQSLDKKGGVYKVDSAAFCFLVSCSFVNRRRACGSCG